MSDDQKLCDCGQPISRWSICCGTCHDKRTIAAATKVEPSSPLCLVGSDTFFWDLEAAEEDYPGAWAHPCDEEPLKVNPKRLAEYLVERAIEDMCEEAFEDAADHVKGEEALLEAVEAALGEFNKAQTSCSWVPRTKEVFQIPGGEQSS